MRAQKMAALEPEGILHVPRRVIGRDVERVEVVIFGFHLGAIEDGETERNEQVLQLALDLRNRVQVAAARSGRGQREI